MDRFLKEGDPPALLENMFTGGPPAGPPPWGPHPAHWSFGEAGGWRRSGFALKHIQIPSFTTIHAQYIQHLKCMNSCLYLFLWFILVHPFLLLFIPHNLKNTSILLINATKQDGRSWERAGGDLEEGAYRFVLVVWQMCFVLSFWIQPGQPTATRSLMKNQMQHSFH